MLDNTYRLLASVTVVRGLYDSEKNIYDVLGEFISELISREHLQSVSAIDLTDRLNRRYSFRLNEAVIKNCLRKMGVKRENNGMYNCQSITGGYADIEQSIRETNIRNEKLFSRLFEFLE